MQFNTFKKWLTAILLLVLTLSLGYGVEQSDFTPLAGLYVAFFVLYVTVFKQVKDNSTIQFFIGVAVVLRFSLLFGMPNLSDDIYRFIWDGRLLLQGYNPFDHLPTYYIENNVQITGITQALYEQLNSPNYFTIYPPIAQLNFFIAVWLFPDSLLGSAVVMKLFLFLFEIGNIFLIIKLLQAFKLPAKNVLLYALNPLLIIEITGNLHFEGAMIFFLLLALYLVVVRQLWQWSAVAFALSIASKLLPLMFLPFLIFRLGWKRSIYYFSIIGAVLLLLFFPLVSGVFVNNFGNSLNLYFQKFEFNASVYYIFRWLGYQWKGYNLIQDIGPRLAMGTVLGIVMMFLYEAFKTKVTWATLPTKMLFAITLYLLFTTTVHPWYTALPVVLCLFTRFRFPILWSALIVLTYINYSYGEYWENLWIVALEYGLVSLFFIIEWRKVRTPLF